MFVAKLKRNPIKVPDPRFVGVTQVHIYPLHFSIFSVVAANTASVLVFFGHRSAAGFCVVLNIFSAGLAKESPSTRFSPSQCVSCSSVFALWDLSG